MKSDRIVAVGLLTERDLDLLGPTFQRLWRVESAPGFTELLKAIDEADRKLRGANGVRANSGNSERLSAP